MLGRKLYHNSPRYFIGVFLHTHFWVCKNFRAFPWSCFSGFAYKICWEPLIKQFLAFLANSLRPLRLNKGIYPFDSTCVSPTCPFCPFCKKMDAPASNFGQGRPTQKGRHGFVKLTVMAWQRPATRLPNNRHSTLKFRIRQPAPLT